MDWLWSYKGKLLIISTPFHEGVHYATSLEHFLPIINHLSQLHSQGFVHGDIRAYNMVLHYHAASTPESDQGVIGNSSSTTKDKYKGCLIDFDYGGKQKAVCYPKGYKKWLADGNRPGKENVKITIMDDWKSLISLIFHAYSFVKKETANLTDRHELLKLTDEQIRSIYDTEKALKEYKDQTVDGDDPMLSNWVHPSELLREYIDLTSTIYDVKPNSNFEEDLQKCGLWLTNVPFNASQAATGSPQK